MILNKDNMLMAKEARSETRIETNSVPNGFLGNMSSEIAMALEWYVDSRDAAARMIEKLRHQEKVTAS